MVTPLGKAIEFFRDFGLFDIVLPFLLVFAIVFAVLEKTRILGTVKIKGGKGEEEITSKNLNAVVAFVVAMLVVAAANITGVINEALPNIVLLLVVLISFLLLIGVFAKTEELDFHTKHGHWTKAFMILIFMGVLLIFLGAIRDKAGKSWLEITFNWVVEQWQGPIFASIIIFILAIGAIIWLTGNPKATTTPPAGTGGAR